MSETNGNESRKVIRNILENFRELRKSALGLAEAAEEFTRLSQAVVGVYLDGHQKQDNAFEPDPESFARLSNGDLLDRLAEEAKIVMAIRRAIETLGLTHQGLQDVGHMDGGVLRARFDTIENVAREIITHQGLGGEEAAGLLVKAAELAEASRPGFMVIKRGSENVIN